MHWNNWVIGDSKLSGVVPAKNIFYIFRCVWGSLLTRNWFDIYNDDEYNVRGRQAGKNTHCVRKKNTHWVWPLKNLFEYMRANYPHKPTQYKLPCMYTTHNVVLTSLQRPERWVDAAYTLCTYWAVRTWDVPFFLTTLFIYIESCARSWMWMTIT